MDDSAKAQGALWRSFARGVKAEPREATEIQGASGLVHRVQAIAVDDATKRIIVVSAEASPRIAALMQTDIQAAIPDTHVLVARPIAMDLGGMARAFAAVLGENKVTKEALAKFGEMTQGQPGGTDEFKKELTTIFAPIEAVFSRVSLPPLDQIMSFFQQLSLLDWPEMLGRMQSDSTGLLPVSWTPRKGVS